MLGIGLGNIGSYLYKYSGRIKKYWLKNNCIPNVITYLLKIEIGKRV